MQRIMMLVISVLLAGIACSPVTTNNFSRDELREVAIDEDDLLMEGLQKDELLSRFWTAGQYSTFGGSPEVGDYFEDRLQQPFYELAFYRAHPEEQRYSIQTWVMVLINSDTATEVLHHYPNIYNIDWEEVETSTYADDSKTLFMENTSGSQGMYAIIMIADNVFVSLRVTGYPDILDYDDIQAYASLLEDRLLNLVTAE